MAYTYFGEIFRMATVNCLKTREFKSASITSRLFRKIAKLSEKHLKEVKLSFLCVTSCPSDDSSKQVCSISPDHIDKHNENTNTVTHTFACN